MTSKLKLLSSALSGEAGAMCPLQMWSDALHVLLDEEQSQKHTWAYGALEPTCFLPIPMASSSALPWPQWHTPFSKSWGYLLVGGAAQATYLPSHRQKQTWLRSNTLRPPERSRHQDKTSSALGRQWASLPQRAGLDVVVTELTAWQTWWFYGSL